MFFVKFTVAKARFESNHNPRTSYRESFSDANGRVVSRGLSQMSLLSSRNYQGCRAYIRTEQDLHNPARNIACSLRITKHWLDHDGVLAGQTRRGGWRGSSRYWAVLRTSRTLNAIRSETRAFCTALQRDNAYSTRMASLLGGPSDMMIAPGPQLPTPPRTQIAAVQPTRAPARTSQESSMLWQNVSF
jgi:hypothetical protein